MKKFVRKLSKISSHSYVINVPKELIRKFGWKEKQKLTISEKARKRIEVKDWKRK